MSEEAKPWRAWGEWERIRSVVRNCDPLIQFDVQEGLDAICARVWREAENRRAEISVEGTRDILDELQAERARAEAAEVALAAMQPEAADCCEVRDGYECPNPMQHLAQVRARADAAEARAARLAAALRSDLDAIRRWHGMSPEQLTAIWGLEGEAIDQIDRIRAALAEADA